MEHINKVQYYLQQIKSELLLYQNLLEENITEHMTIEPIRRGTIRESR